MNRTDLAHEIASESGLSVEETILGGMKITRVVIDERAGEKAKKPKGAYITLHCHEKPQKNESTVLCQVLAKMLSEFKSEKVLVTGLGNNNITPDSLGVRTAARILATAHFKSLRDFAELGLREVYTIEPGVMAQTGLESAEQLRFVADGIKPDCLIVIDSLACNERERLARTIQVTDSGIAPGSGVKNERKEFSAKTFNVPVIAIGVPTVMDWDGFMVVPKDIDSIISRYTKTISSAVNHALNPNLDDEEIESLLQ